MSRGPNGRRQASLDRIHNRRSADSSDHRRGSCAQRSWILGPRRFSGCLAVVRMIGSPWIFFTTITSLLLAPFFRPLGFASMWLCEKLFGTAYAPNAAFDIGLQVAVALALCRAAVHAGAPILPAALISLIFALHPATSATSMWWSARFDLLATLFVLLSVDAAIRFRDRERVVDLAAALPWRWQRCCRRKSGCRSCRLHRFVGALVHRIANASASGAMGIVLARCSRLVFFSFGGGACSARCPAELPAPFR